MFRVILKPVFKSIPKIAVLSFIFALVAGFLNPLDARADESAALSGETIPVNLVVTKSHMFLGDSKTPTITVRRKMGTSFPTIPKYDYYWVHLYNIDTGKFVSSEGEMTPNGSVTLEFPDFVPAGDHQYKVFLTHEEYLNPDPIEDITNFTNAIGSSEVVEYDRKPITLSLDSIDPVVDYAHLEWTLNQEINGKDYSIHLFDIDTGELMWASRDKNDSLNSINFKFGESHNYQAFLTKKHEYSDGLYSDIENYNDITDIAAASNVFALVRAGWDEVSLHQSSDNPHNLYLDVIEGGGEYATYIVHNETQQIIWDSVSPDKDPYWDITNPTSSSNPKAFTAYVARSWKEKHGSEIFSPKPIHFSELEDIIADSNGLTAPTSGVSDPNQIAGGKNPNEICSQSCHGDPINTATGEFFDNKTDLEAIGNGLAPSIQRSFSTTNKDNLNLLGYGWRTNYEMKIVSDDDKSDKEGYDTNILASKFLWLENENSSLTSFYRELDGTFSSASKTNATLEFNVDTQTFIFNRGKKETYIFDAAGKLIKIQNDRSQSVTLTYDNGKLLSAANSAGQILTFNYNTNDLISTITRENGREVKYTYNTKKELTQVTNSKGVTYSYAYDNSRRVKTLSNELGGITTNTYNSSNQVTQQKDPLGRIMTFTYIGQMSDGTTRIKYPNGNVIEETYNRGQLIQKVENYGKSGSLTWRYGYNARNELISVINPDSSNSTQLYDKDGNLIKSLDSNGNSTTFTYDERSNLLTSKDPYGNVTTNAYDENDNLISSTTPLGETTTFTYNPDKSLASSTDVRGNTGTANPEDFTTAYTYLSTGALTQLTTPLSSQITMSYNSYGDMISTKDGRGNTTAMEYNNLGLLSKVIDPLQNETAMTYDKMGNMLTSRNAHGAVTSYTYDLVGNTLTSTNALNETTTYAYDSMNQPVSITQADGTIQTITYDIFGRATEIKDELLRTTKQEWDSNNRLKASINPDGGRTEYTYDTNGNLKTVKTPKGAITRFDYDKMNRLIKTTDALGRSTTTEYDINGRISKTTAADETVEEIAYDEVGNIIATTNKAGDTKTYTYDSQNRKTSYINELGQATTYSYDANSNLISETRQDASVVTYSYELRNLLTDIDYPGTEDDIAYTYDNLGRKSSERKGNSLPVAYTYDILNRVLSRGTPDNTVSYNYDNVGNLTSLTYPSGRVVTYDYDNAKQLTQLNTAGVGEITFDYNNRGLLSSSSYANGVTESQGYDNDNQLTSTELVNNGTLLYQRTQTYNPVGEVTQRGTTTNSTALQLENFVYDPLSRLIEQKTDTTGETLNAYNYNSIGNLTLTSNKIQTFDVAGKLTVSGNTTVSYDARNNRISLLNSVDAIKNIEYTWTQNNLLSSVTTNQDSSTTKNVAYTYGTDSLLDSRTIDAVTNTFIWDTSREIPVMLSDGKYEYVYSNERVPVAQIETLSGVITYLHNDLTGSVTASTDTSGQLVGTVDFTPYGTPTGPLLSSFGYAGEWVDEATGYSYNRARWLDTLTGTFLSEDPLVQLTDNAFGYSDGNPITQIDPRGLFFEKVGKWLSDDDNVEMIGNIGTVLGGIGMALSIASIAFPILGPIAFATSTVSLGLGATATLIGCINDYRREKGSDDCIRNGVVTAASAIAFTKPITKLGKFSKAPQPKGKDIESGRTRGLQMGAQVAYGYIQTVGFSADMSNRYMTDSSPFSRKDC